LTDDQLMPSSYGQVPVIKNAVKRGIGLQNLFSSSGRFNRSLRSLKRYKLCVLNVPIMLRNTYEIYNSLRFYIV